MVKSSVASRETTRRGRGVEEIQVLYLNNDLLEKIATANSIIFRISGKKGREDKVLTEADKNGIHWLLEIYKNIQKSEVVPK